MIHHESGEIFGITPAHLHLSHEELDLHEARLGTKAIKLALQYGHTEKNAAPLHIVYRLSATTQRTFSMLRAKAAKAQASLHTMNNEKAEADEPLSWCSVIPQNYTKGQTHAHAEHELGEYKMPAPHRVRRLTATRTKTIGLLVVNDALRSAKTSFPPGQMIPSSYSWNSAVLGACINPYAVECDSADIVNVVAAIYKFQTTVVGSCTAPSCNANPFTDNLGNTNNLVVQLVGQITLTSDPWNQKTGGSGWSTGEVGVDNLLSAFHCWRSCCGATTGTSLNVAQPAFCAAGTLRSTTVFPQHDNAQLFFGPGLSAKRFGLRRCEYHVQSFQLGRH